MIDIKRRLEGEIRTLEHELKIQLPTEIQKDRVGLGSTVTLRETATGDQIVYDLVTPEEADPTQGRISPSSPIGRSLLNHEEGDVVEVRVPSGMKEYEITRLVTIHDQAEKPAAEA